MEMSANPANMLSSKDMDEQCQLEKALRLTMRVEQQITEIREHMAHGVSAEVVRCKAELSMLLKDTEEILDTLESTYGNYILTREVDNVCNKGYDLVDEIREKYEGLEAEVYRRDGFITLRKRTFEEIVRTERLVAQARRSVEASRQRSRFFEKSVTLLESGEVFNHRNKVQLQTKQLNEEITDEESGFQEDANEHDVNQHDEGGVKAKLEEVEAVNLSTVETGIAEVDAKDAVVEKEEAKSMDELLNTVKIRTEYADNCQHFPLGRSLEEDILKSGMKNEKRINDNYSPPKQIEENESIFNQMDRCETLRYKLWRKWREKPQAKGVILTSLQKFEAEKRISDLPDPIVAIIKNTSEDRIARINITQPNYDQNSKHLEDKLAGLRNEKLPLKKLQLHHYSGYLSLTLCMITIVVLLIICAYRQCKSREMIRVNLTDRPQNVHG